MSCQDKRIFFLRIRTQIKCHKHINMINVRREIKKIYGVVFFKNFLSREKNVSIEHYNVKFVWSDPNKRSFIRLYKYGNFYISQFVDWVMPHCIRLYAKFGVVFFFSKSVILFLSTACFRNILWLHYLLTVKKTTVVNWIFSISINIFYYHCVQFFKIFHNIENWYIICKVNCKTQ